jgi:hypothetical protein
MSLILKKNEVCPYSNICPHNKGTFICQGANPNRTNEFVCDFVNENGSFREDRFRSKHDTTGKMEIILEEENR